jgi:glutamate racemase
VVRFIFAHLPQERIVYFGDTARIPYGSRTPGEVIRFGEEIVSFLLRYQVKAVVAACNTSSSVSLPVLREKFSVPILGVVEPGARAALKVTRNGRVGVIATSTTVQSGAYPRAIKANCGERKIEVFTQACPRFVHLVEAGETETSEAYELARQYVEPLQEAGIDTLVLGCTHYPFLTKVLTGVLGPTVKLVDPAVETVSELSELLERRNDLSDGNSTPRHLFFASGSVASFYNTGRQFLGNEQLQVEQATVEQLK